MSTLDSPDVAAETKAVKVGPVAFTWRGERPIASWAEDTVTVAIGFVGVAAMYWDSWRHNTKAIESDNFWSAPHVALYLALLAFALWIGLIVLRSQPNSDVLDLAAIPRGYGVGLVGLGLAGVGGIGDFIWHSIYGFEDQVNAFWSPPHQVLFYGGVLLTAAPFISSWFRSSGRLDARAALPVVGSLTLLIGTATFAITHLSPLWNNVAATDAFQDDIARFSDSYPPGELLPGQVGLDAALRSFGDESFPYYFYSFNQSVAALLLMAFTLTAPVLLLVRRWRPPPGAVTVLFGLYGLLYSIPTEFRDIELVAGLVAAGILIDALIARLRPELPARPWQFRALGASVPLLSVGGYLLALEVLGLGLAWEISVWGGVVITSTMIGLGLACLMAPPGTSTD